MKQYRGLQYRFEGDVSLWYVFDENELLEMCHDEAEVREYIDYIVDSESWEEDWAEHLHQSDAFYEEY